MIKKNVDYSILCILNLLFLYFCQKRSEFFLIIQSNIRKIYNHNRTSLFIFFVKSELFFIRFPVEFDLRFFG